MGTDGDTRDIDTVSLVEIANAMRISAARSGGMSQTEVERDALRSGVSSLAEHVDAWYPTKVTSTVRDRCAAASLSPVRRSEAGAVCCALGCEGAAQPPLAALITSSVPAELQSPPRVEPRFAYSSVLGSKIAPSGAGGTLASM